MELVSIPWFKNAGLYDIYFENYLVNILKQDFKHDRLILLIRLIYSQEAKESSASPDNPLTFATPMGAVVAGLASNQLHVTAEFMGFSERYNSPWYIL